MFIPKPYAKAYRVGPKQDVFMDESGLRIQRESPSHVLVQWRVKGKKADGSVTLAYGSLSRKECESLRDFLNAIIPELTDEFGRKIEPVSEAA